MFKFLSAATVSTFLAAGALAQASDAPTASTASAAPDATVWAGPYAGLHVGYGFDDGTSIRNFGNAGENVTAIGAGIRPAQIGQSRSGLLGGGQLGYNWQRGNLIFGVEGDFSYTHQRGDTTYRGLAAASGNPAGDRLNVRSDLDWLGSARGRVGYGLGRGMIYATGGYAFGRVKGSAEFDGASDATVDYYGGHKYTAQGWTAGAGLEFKPFTSGMMSRVSLGLEGSYYDLGRSHIQALSADGAPGSYTLGVKTAGYNAAFKVNYAF